MSICPCQSECQYILSGTRPSAATCLPVPEGYRNKRLVFIFTEVLKMSVVYTRPNVKLAKLWYKYNMEKETNQVKVKEEEIIKEKKDYEAYPPYNFSWFVKNKIAAMACPQSVANLNYLVDVGVNHLITLSPERWPPILECEKNLKWTEIKIKEFGAPSLKDVLKFIEICERAEIRGEVIGVHCRQGRGRTGTMLACYLVHFQNMAPERAVLTVRLQRPGSCETYEQEKMVCHYHDCIRGTISKADYRMVEDKLYFDCSMKYMYNDDENTKHDETPTTTQQADENTDVEGEKEKKNNAKKKVSIQLEKEKSKAMVINHKIYF